MTRFGLFVAALVAALLIVWGAGHYALSRVPAGPRPESNFARRNFPDRDENESAARVLSTVARFDEAQLLQNRDAEIEYLREQIASNDMTTAPPPERLAKFLAANAVTISTLRAELGSNPPPAWKLRADELLDTPQPDAIVISRLFLMLASDAVAEHSRRNDPAAWSDLGAMWSLAKSLWVRPELYSVLGALTGTRIIAAVATKLPPPVPVWWSDYMALDPRGPLAHALDYDAWAMRMRAERYPAGEPDEDAFRETVRRLAEPFARPLRVMIADRQLREMRRLRELVAVADPCGSSRLPDDLRRWSSMLQRVHRFMIEREGTAKLLAIEEQRRGAGTWPDSIDERSMCPREHWRYKRDGATIDLAFSGHLPAPQTRIVTPLQYRR